MRLLQGLLIGILMMLPVEWPAQAEQKPVGDVAATIIQLLSEQPSESRAQRLYALALDLFRSIDAATPADKQVEPARAVMARALREAAEGGVADAWLDYGRCLWNGWGVPQDRESAVVAYKAGAAQGAGYGNYLAAYNLYWAFQRYDEAYAYAQKALKDDPGGETRYLLGLMAYNGRGRPKDIQEALRLHTEAAKFGNPDAQFELFVLAMNGVGDRAKALLYLREAARREQPRAMANLAALHATGELGVEKNLEEAVKWYRGAADKGIARAAAALGVMAMRGEGMPKDEAVARSYFARAEALGFDIAPYLRANRIERP
jgi:TPR repeat protein